MSHYLLTYELAPDYLTRRVMYRDQHLTLAWQEAEAGTLLLGGAVGVPVESALLLFTTEDSAKAFARADPYVQEGLVTNWQVKPWATVVGKTAAAPVHPKAKG